MSRNKAFKELSLEEYKRQMEGIFTTCVNKETIDESPMAYKPLASILENIKPTVDVVKRILPVYNFKANE